MIQWLGFALLAAATFLLLSHGASVMKLTASQIADLARNAGFSGADLATAVAVALAESGGNVYAYNAETQAGTPQSKGSYGLWQIYRQAHPEFDGWDLNDPKKNAEAAFDIYKKAGHSFRDWSTFKHGNYLAHLSVVQGAISV